MRFVKSCDTSVCTSKPSTNARSAGCITCRKKSVAACCSNWNRCRIELLVSSRTPTRNGRFVCCVKLRTRTGGLPSSSNPKFCCCNPVTKRPFFPVTVKMRSTSFVVTVIVLVCPSSGGAASSRGVNCGEGSAGAVCCVGACWLGVCCVVVCCDGACFGTGCACIAAEVSANTASTAIERPESTLVVCLFTHLSYQFAAMSGQTPRTNRIPRAALTLRILQRRQHLNQILRQCSLQLQPLLCLRMQKLQLGRVQKVPLQLDRLASSCFATGIILCGAP